MLVANNKTHKASPRALYANDPGAAIEAGKFACWRFRIS